MMIEIYSEDEDDDWMTRQTRGTDDLHDAARGSVVEPGHDVRLPEHLELLTIHLDLVPPELWQQHLVPHGDAHGHGVPSLCPRPGSHRDHYTFVGLGLGLLGDQQPSLGLYFSCRSLNEDTVKKWHNPFGNSGHDRHDEEEEWTVYLL